MIVCYIEVSGNKFIWDSLDAWSYVDVYSQKHGYLDREDVWSNHTELQVLVF